MRNGINSEIGEQFRALFAAATRMTTDLGTELSTMLEEGTRTPLDPDHAKRLLDRIIDGISKSRGNHTSESNPRVTTLLAMAMTAREHMDDVDPRAEADGQIVRAFQTVVNASDDDPDHARAARDYTPEELDTLFFSLSMALIQLRKVPGGTAARDRFYERAEGDLLRRGRQDILDKLDAEAKIELVSAALDELGVPRHAGPGEPVSEGQPIPLESRIGVLCAEVRRLRGQTRMPARHRRVQRLVTVKESDLTIYETAYATRRIDLPGMCDVIRWDDTDAVKEVKRAFGDDVDFSDGTFGDTLVKLVMLTQEKDVALRDELLALVSKFEAK